MKPEPPTIDWNRVGQMFEAGATLDGVLAMMGVSREDLFAGCLEDNGVDLLTFAKQRRAKGEELIRIKQFHLAMQGDKSMLRQIGKQRAGGPNLTVVPSDEGELISLSEIAKRCEIDRTTCRNRLDDLGYTPEVSESKLKLYRFDAAMEAALLAKSGAYGDAKLRDITAAAELKELKLKEALGELVPIMDAVEMMQATLSAHYKEFSIHQPKRLASRLAKAKTPADVVKILKADTDKIYARLRQSNDKLVPDVAGK